MAAADGPRLKGGMEFEALFKGMRGAEGALDLVFVAEAFLVGGMLMVLKLKAKDSKSKVETTSRR